MKSVNSKIYDKNYYQTICLGSEEFRKKNGRTIHDRWKNLLKDVPVADTKILDVGCGRGDITLYLAKDAREVVGIDYSKDGILLANKIKQKFPPTIQRRTKFKVMNIKKLNFPANYFDVIICIDVIEHLYKSEVRQAMREISRVLKKDGVLFIHTGPNKLLYDFTYHWYILPVNKLLTKLDQIIKQTKYKSFPNDPRTQIEKEQHVNEPTYFYLNNLLKRYKFEGTIKMQTGYMTPVKGFRSVLYNAVTTLHPLSKLFPLNTIFTWSFSGVFKNKK